MTLCHENCVHPSSALSFNIFFPSFYLQLLAMWWWKLHLREWSHNMKRSLYYRSLTGREWSHQSFQTEEPLLEYLKLKINFYWVKCFGVYSHYWGFGDYSYYCNWRDMKPKMWVKKSIRTAKSVKIFIDIM